MTEAEWIACTDPVPMLNFFHGKECDRKMRLFLVACSRRAWHLLTDERSRDAVEVAERFVEGLASEEEREAASHAAVEAVSATFDVFQSLAMTDNTGSVPHEYGSPEKDIFHAANCVATTIEPRERLIWGKDGPHYTPVCAALNAAWAIWGWRGNNYEAAVAAETAEQFAQHRLLHCIFGNPFRPLTINPIWLTPTMTNLAAAAYEERSLPSGQLDTARLAVLAAALEETGCQDAAILDHLRSDGPHVRGCWPVDLILGKS